MAVNQNFRVKNGLAVTTTATIEGITQSISTSTGALQVSGGAGIGGNLYVGGTTNIAGATIITDNTVATSTITGALQVVGGAGIGGNLWVGGDFSVDGTFFGTVVGVITTATNLFNGTLGEIPYQTAPGKTGFFGPGTPGNILVSNGAGSPSFNNTLTLTSTLTNTATVAGNALQVYGGVGIDGGLFVNGPAFFNNDVVFSGSATSVYSTSTLYTDNFIDLHFPSGEGGTGGVWTVDDGKDIGHIYHHYKEATGDEHGALIWHNASDELRWYMGNVEYVNGAQEWSFSTATYGVFRTGSIFLVNTTTSTSTDTGALVVSGGVGIAGNIYIGSNANIAGITTSTNTTNATSTNSGALQVFGGVGIGGNLYVGGNSNIIGNEILTGNLIVNGGSIITNSSTFNLVNTTATTVNFAGSGTAITIGATTGYTAIRNATTITNSTAATSTSTGALQVRGGAGIGGDLYVGGTIFATVNGATSTASNLINGSAGQIPIQSAPGITSFISTGSVGDLLQQQTGNTSTFVSTSTLLVGLSVTATNIAAGTAGQVPYQSAPGVTGFTGPGSTGQVLVSRNSTGPIFQNTLTLAGTTSATSTITGALQVVGGVGIGGNLYVGGTIFGALVGTVTTATNVAGGAAGSIPIQTSPGVTSFINTGSVGNLLQQQTGNTSTFVSTATLLVGMSVTATNIAAGTAGQLHYQSAAGITSFVSTGSAGQVLVSAGTTSTGPVFQNTLTLDGTTQSTSTITGALQVVGGVGIGGNLYVGGATNITLDTNSTSTTTGALIVTGGVGIGADLRIGGLIYGVFAGTVSGAVTSATNLTNGTMGQVPFQTNTGTTSFFGPGTTGQLLVSAGTTSTGPVFTNTASIYVGNATSSIFADTATNIAAGTVAQLHYQSNTGTTSFVSAGTAGQLLVSAGTTSTGPVFTNTASIYVGNATFAVTATNIAAGTAGQLHYQSAPGITGFAGPGTAGQVLVSVGTTSTGPVFQNTLTLAGTTQSTSTTTGALQVVGGVGIGGNLYVGGTIYGAFGGTITTATNVASGTAGQILIQSAPGLTSFISTGSVGNLLQQQTGNTATFISTATLLVGASVTATNIAAGTVAQLHYQSNTGTTSFVSAGTAGQLLVSAGTTSTGPVFTNTASIYVGNATFAVTAKNLSDGAAGSVPYQSGSGATTMLALASTAGYVITAGASSIYWSSPAVLTAGQTDAVKITNDTASTSAQYITFVGTSTGYSEMKTAYASGLTYTPSSGYVGINITTSSALLDVGGTVRISGITTITNTTAASSTITGALQVIGGVGIGGNVYIGGNSTITGNETITGDLAVNGGDITTNQATFNLVNATATTVNFAGAGTTISIGAATGTTTVKHNLTVVGNMTVQGTTTIVDSTVTNITDPILTLGGIANNQPLTSNDSKDKGIAFKYWNGGAKTGFFGYKDQTGLFTFLTNATITSEQVSGTKGVLDININGGAAQSLVYQSAANTTGFIAAGTAGYILQTNGTGATPTWVAPSGLSAGSASQLSTVAALTNASHYLTFVDSNNATATAESFYTTSSFVINPGTGYVGIGAASPASSLQIIGLAQGQTTGAITDAGSMSGIITVADSNNQLSGGGGGIVFGSGATRFAAIKGYTTGGAGSTVGDLMFSTRNATTDASLTERMRIYANGNVGIGTATPAYKLEVNGSFAATTKSFVIDHPTKPGMKLRYGSLEGPENGVYVRGKLTDSNKIELPDYWTKLVDPNSITVTLTSIGKHQELYVAKIADNIVTVRNGKKSSKDINCFYVVYGERCDVDKLIVEI